MAKMRILKFGSKTCGACLAMDKAKTLDKLQAEFPDLKIVKLDVSDENGDSPAAKFGDPTSVDYKRNYKISDEYGVNALPTLVLEVEGSGEVARVEGAAGLKQLREMVEETVEYAKRAEESVPW